MRRIIPIIIATILLAATLTTTCRNRSGYRWQLEIADSLAEVNPDSAVRLLAQIPTVDMPRAERALHALLSVKAADKAYIEHKSDSTINVALSYFGSHGPKLRRAEALYYKGRVSADMMDFPTALDAYDDALRMLPDDNSRKTLQLQCLINTLTGQLLSDLKLSKESMPFFLAAIEADMQLGDTLGAALDINDIVQTLISLDSIDAAYEMLMKATPLSEGLPSDDHATLDISMRRIMLSRGKPKEAIRNIDSLLSEIKPKFRNYALMVAVKSYQELGLTDSASHYAYLLTKMHHPSNRFIGYSTLLQNENKNFDSLKYYANKLAEEYNYKLISVNSKLPVLGHSFYKHSLLVKDHEKLLRSSHQRDIAFLILIFVVVILSGIILIRHLQREKRLLTQLNNYNGMLLAAHRETPPAIEEITETREQFIDRIKEKVAELTDHEQPDTELLQQACKNCDTDDARATHIEMVMEQLADELTRTAPQFIPTVNLVFENPKHTNLRILMLTRAGFDNGQIAEMLCINKNSVHKAKSRMRSKAFGPGFTREQFDQILLNLEKFRDAGC